MKQATISIHADTGDLTIRSRYDAGFVADIKVEIPSFARRWDPDLKVWVVQEVYGADAVLVAERYYSSVAFHGEPDRIQSLTNQVSLLRIARAHHAAQDAQPQYVTPLEVNTPEKLTYFGILGVSIDADENAIRQGYKTAARSAHPDGGGSHEQFLAVQKAYDTLRDPKMRKKYVFGLKLVGEVKLVDAFNNADFSPAPPTRKARTNPTTKAQASADLIAMLNLALNLQGKKR